MSQTCRLRCGCWYISFASHHVAAPGAAELQVSNMSNTLCDACLLRRGTGYVSFSSLASAIRHHCMVTSPQSQLQVQWRHIHTFKIALSCMCLIIMWLHLEQQSFR
jgi:hypothetical protein